MLDKTGGVAVRPKFELTAKLPANEPVACPAQCGAPVRAPLPPRPLQRGAGWPFQKARLLWMREAVAALSGKAGRWEGSI